MSAPNGAEESPIAITSEAPHAHVIEPTPESKGHKHSTSSSSLHNAKGWDGKLRVEKKAVLVNPEVLDGDHSDPEESDNDAVPVDQIEADEGEPETFGFGR
jgi:protein phosphatase 1 regulatory subunit 7